MCLHQKRVSDNPGGTESKGKSPSILLFSEPLDFGVSVSSLYKSEPTADLLGAPTRTYFPTEKEAMLQLPQEGAKPGHHLASATFRLQVGSFRKDSNYPSFFLIRTRPGAPELSPRLHRLSQGGERYTPRTFFPLPWGWVLTTAISP